MERYEIGEDFIRVMFSDGSLYLYTDESAGAFNIGQMKNLAEQGWGLNSYIIHNVRYNYADKQI